MKKIFRNISLCLAGVCAIIAVVSYGREQNAGKGYDDLRDSVMLTENSGSDEPLDMVLEDGTERETASETEEWTEVQESETEQLSEETDETEGSPETEELSEAEPVEIPIDFASLQEMNPDIYAWIQVEGTPIDYPIVQHPEDNRFYLDHTAEGEEAIEGALFTEDYNELDFQDPNTVIYGHNMRNGSMFGSLQKFRDRDFFNENREITVYLPDEILHYEIFAAYLYDSRHLLQSFDFSDEDVFEDYIRSIFSVRGMESFVDSSVEVDKDSKILTLSTCYKGMDEKRYLVQAVLVSEEK